MYGEKNHLIYNILVPLWTKNVLLGEAFKAKTTAVPTNKEYKQTVG